MSIFVLNARGLTEEEMALAQPDHSEAKNLARHVEKCQLRYRVFVRRQADQGNDLVQIKYMMICLIGAVLLTSPQVRDFLSWASKVF